MITSNAASATVRHRLLPILPIVQQGPQSCWLAVAEMVLRYFEVPVDHLSVLDLQNPTPQCTIYIVTIAPPDHGCNPKAENLLEVRSVMSQYAIALRSTGKAEYSGLGIISTREPIPSSISFLDIRNELDAGRPIALVLNVAGTDHVVLVVGYDDLGGENQYITINDPFDYQNAQNPWATFATSSARPRQYTLTLSELSAAAQWTDTLTGFRTPNFPKPFGTLDAHHPDQEEDQALESEFMPTGPPDLSWRNDIAMLMGALRSASSGDLERLSESPHFGQTCPWLAKTQVLSCAMLANDGSDGSINAVLNKFAASLPSGFHVVKGIQTFDYWISNYNIEFHADGRIIYIDALRR